MRSLKKICTTFAKFDDQNFRSCQEKNIKIILFYNAGKILLTTESSKVVLPSVWPDD